MPSGARNPADYAESAIQLPRISRFSGNAILSWSSSHAFAPLSGADHGTVLRQHALSRCREASSRSRTAQQESQRLSPALRQRPLDVAVRIASVGARHRLDYKTDWRAFRRARRNGYRADGPRQRYRLLLAVRPGQAAR